MHTPNIICNITEPNELKKYNEIDPINKAMFFLNSCFEEELCYDFICIVSNDYTNDANKYHIKSDDSDDSNGTFIPTFFQKNQLKKILLLSIGRKGIYFQKQHSFLFLFMSSYIF